MANNTSELLNMSSRSIRGNMVTPDRRAEATGNNASLRPGGNVSFHNRQVIAESALNERSSRRYSNRTVVDNTDLNERSNREYDRLLSRSVHSHATGNAHRVLTNRKTTPKLSTSSLPGDPNLAYPNFQPTALFYGPTPTIHANAIPLTADAANQDDASER
jgi:hypothetical protein